MNKKILIIGTGGIGTELIKLLYLSNKKEITLIDYDTISLSNLNRQFLFKKNEINLYKSETAAKAYKTKLKNAKVRFETKNIKIFDVSFFKQFCIVYNCLDNEEARSYVNFRCLLGDVPLIDGGSTGFLGQAWYYGRKSECYDCLEKEEKKKFIPYVQLEQNLKSTSIVLFGQRRFFFDEFLCGKTCEDFGEEMNEENKKIEENNFITQENGKKNSENTHFEECFEDVKKRKLNDIFIEVKNLFDKEDYNFDNEDEFMIEKIVDLYEKLKLRVDLQFDKDDDDIMEIIYSAALLRSKIFKITPEDKFKTGDIAGNIIPAVSTTNSIVASLMFAMGEKLLLKKLIDKNYFLSKGKRLILFSKLGNKNTDCQICTKETFVFTKKNSLTMREFLNIIKNKIKGKLALYCNNNLLYDFYYQDNIEKNFEIEFNEIVIVKNDLGMSSNIYIAKGNANKLIKIY
ncbi:E1 ubiquitin-activating protein uba2 [Gurleya vavrai]